MVETAELTGFVQVIGFDMAGVWTYVAPTGEATIGTTLTPGSFRTDLTQAPTSSIKDLSSE